MENVGEYHNIGSKYFWNLTIRGGKGRKERFAESFRSRYLAPFARTHQFPVSIFTTYSHVVKLGKECKVNVTFALCARPGTGVSAPRVVHGSKFAEFKAPMQVRVKQTQGEKSAAGKKKEYRVSESDISESLEEGAPSKILSPSNWFNLFFPFLLDYTYNRYYYIVILLSRINSLLSE